MTDGQPQATFGLLFVCTGNVCRSPTAQALMRRRVAERGVGEEITVGSAGVGTQDGWLIDPATAELLEKRGLPAMAGFRSRLVTEQILAEADLILTGTRDHRLWVGKNWPPAYSRTYTLRESAWLLGGMPAEVREQLPRPVVERARAVVSWLHDERGQVVTPESELDVADPIGRRMGVYRRMVDEVSAAIDVVAGVLLSPAD